MSGGSKKYVTVGYSYYLGAHFILCRGEVDKFWTVTVDDKVAININAGAGAYYINNPNLFGGEKREGGISGSLALYNGSSSQGRDPYLQSVLGASVPAFRGVVSAIIKNMYVGINPYLRKWAFKATRINKLSNGSTQWYQPKASIFRNYIDKNPTVAFYFALDRSNSMNADGRLSALKSGVIGMLDYIYSKLIPMGVKLDVCIVRFNSSASSITRRNVDATALADLKSFVSSTSASGGTNFEVAFSELATFKASTALGSHKIECILVSDGIVSEVNANAARAIIDAQNSNSSGFGIGGASLPILNIIDNTNGAQILPTTESAIRDALISVIYIQTVNDMNPSHIIRECLTDVIWGLGYADSDINDASFTLSADKLFDESFGLSFYWERESSIYEFIKLILNHIGGVLYQDFETGKWNLKLIRDDYVIGSLLVLDETNIADIKNLKSKDPSELINQVTVVFQDTDKENSNSITIQNLASIEQYGRVNSQSFQYNGITKSSLAIMVANRELQANSTEIFGCSIYANREASILKIGDVFLLNYDFKTVKNDIKAISNLAMRVTSIDYGNHESNQIRIDCVQDFFKSGVSIYDPIESEWVSPSVDAIDIPDVIIYESPYYELAQILGDDDASAEAVGNGYMVATATLPGEGYFGITIFTEQIDYVETGSAAFCPYGIATTPITYSTTSLILDSAENIGLVSLGTYAMIGKSNAEIIKITSTTENIDGTWTIEFGRGCLDTVRKEHISGTYIYFVDEFVGNDGIAYESSDTVNFKLLGNTSNGIIDIADATAHPLTFTSRKDKPYPPANVRINGEVYPSVVSDLIDLTVVWVERNRLQQTAYIVNDKEATITPEAGTTYTIEIYEDSGGGINGSLIHSETGITGTTGTVLIADFGAFTGNMIFYLWSVRDGFDSYQKHKILFSRG